RTYWCYPRTNLDDPDPASVFAVPASVWDAIAQVCPVLAQVWDTLARVHPVLAQVWDTLARVHPVLAQVCTVPARVHATCSNISVQTDYSPFTFSAHVPFRNTASVVPSSRTPSISKFSEPIMKST